MKSARFVGLAISVAHCLTMLCAVAAACPVVNTTTNQVSITSFGAVGNGTTDDTAAIQCALNDGGRIYFPTGNYLVNKNLQVYSNTTLFGSATITGGSGVRTIQIYGTEGAPIAVASPTSAGATTIQVPNSFVPGQMLVLNNFPTAPGGRTGPDYCDMVNNACTYARPGSPQRQNRRREMLVVASTTHSAVTFTTPTLFSYTSNTDNSYLGLSGYAYLTLVNPVSNVAFMGLSFTNLIIDAEYASNLNIAANSALTTEVKGHPCYNCSFSFNNFDANGTNSKVDIYEGSEHIQISGYFVNGACSTDCGIVKVNQASGVSINGSFGPAQNGLGGNEWAVMVDVDYDEDPTGFADVPDMGVIVNATATSSSSPGVFITGPALSASPTNVAVNTSGGMLVQLQGVSGATVSSTGPASSLSIYGSFNVTVNGGNYSSFDMNPATNPYIDNYNIGSQNLAFNGTTFTVTSSLPWFNSVAGLTLTNVAFNVIGSNPTYGAKLSYVSSMLLDDVTATWSGTQPSFWISGPVTNVAHFGGLPMAMPNVTNVR